VSRRPGKRARIAALMLAIAAAFFLDVGCGIGLCLGVPVRTLSAAANKVG